MSNTLRIVPWSDGGKAKIHIAAGDVYLNGHQLKGVLELVPILANREEVAHVVLKLALDRFEFGPDPKVD